MAGRANQRVAVIGAGRMGSRIISSLVDRGWDVIAHDVSPDALARARAVGAAVTASAEEAFDGAGALVSSLPGPDEVNAVVADSGLLGSLAPGAAYLETSTLPVGLVRDLARTAEALNLSYLDCPLSGQPPNATAYVGGRTEDWATWEPLVRSFTTRWFHLGAAGAGTTVKLAGQYLTYVTFLASMEALELVSHHDVDRRGAAEAFRWGSASSRALELVIERLLDARADSGAGTVDLIAKDLAAASSLAELSGRDTPFLEQARHLFEAAQAAGLGPEPSHAVARIIHDLRLHEGARQ